MIKEEDSFFNCFENKSTTFLKELCFKDQLKLLISKGIYYIQDFDGSTFVSCVDFDLIDNLDIYYSWTSEIVQKETNVDFSEDYYFLIFKDQKEYKYSIIRNQIFERSIYFFLIFCYTNEQQGYIEQGKYLHEISLKRTTEKKLDYIEKKARQLDVQNLSHFKYDFDRVSQTLTPPCGETFQLVSELPYETIMSYLVGEHPADGLIKPDFGFDEYKKEDNVVYHGSSSFIWENEFRTYGLYLFLTRQRNKLLEPLQENQKIGGSKKITKGETLSQFQKVAIITEIGLHELLRDKKLPEPAKLIADLLNMNETTYKKHKATLAKMNLNSNQVKEFGIVEKRLGKYK